MGGGVMRLVRDATRWVWMVGALVLALPVLALPVQAQSTQAQSTQTAAVREVLEHPAVSAVRGTLAELLVSDAAGFPVELLVEKVREGTAKHVPPARIVQAVRVVRERVTLAEALLADAPRTPLAARSAAIRGLVDALNAGLTRRDLDAVLVSLGSASRDLAAVREVAVTLAELAERGFAVATAVSATTTAWRRGGLRAMSSVIALAAQLGPNVSARDAALEHGVTQFVSPPGLVRGPSHQSSSTAREAGPPHDDAFGAAQQRGRGLAKGRNR